MDKFQQLCKDTGTWGATDMEGFFFRYRNKPQDPGIWIDITAGQEDFIFIDGSAMNNPDELDPATSLISPTGEYILRNKAEGQDGQVPTSL